MSRPAAVLLVVVAVTSTGAALTVLADPPDPRARGRKFATDAGRADTASDGGTARVAAGFLPDPDGLTTRHQWVLDLAYQAGEVALRGARRVELEKPLKTPRMMGRFAVEIYVGRELLDRVRFDFPLLGASEEGSGEATWNAPPSFDRNLRTSAAVMVPASDRATRALLVDRSSGRTTPLPWPPDARATTAADQAPVPRATPAPGDAGSGNAVRD